ncbi:MAG: ATP-binding cassette domain-containing protein [Xanthobacteraceae bacterium]|jgi:branched-chain amino acid transport system ATP-binding protein
MAASELTVRNLFVSRGGRPVLRDISLSVPPGEITALLGANGAGKSTLVLTMAGVLPPVRGSISCEGVELLGQSPDAVRRHGVALVLEGHPVLTGLSLRDNLAAAAMMHPRHQADREIEAALETFPELRARLSTAAQNLSGGQKQMVVIAQGMIARPRYLLIDELSFGLAPSIVNRLAETIQAIAARGVGILLIEQFTTLALSLARTALVLERGELVFAGASEELRRNPEILHGAYLASGRGPSADSAFAQGAAR